jgi:hypothetical protein
MKMKMSREVSINQKYENKVKWISRNHPSMARAGEIAAAYSAEWNSRRLEKLSSHSDVGREASIENQKREIKARIGECKFEVGSIEERRLVSENLNADELLRWRN